MSPRMLQDGLLRFARNDGERAALKPAGWVSLQRNPSYKLMKMGLVTRTSSGDNARVQKVELTIEGKRFYKKVLPRLHVVEGSIYGRLTTGADHYAPRQAASSSGEISDAQLRPRSR